jgi:PAS domain S-box-containing protein
MTETHPSEPKCSAEEQLNRFREIVCRELANLAIPSDDCVPQADRSGDELEERLLNLFAAYTEVRADHETLRKANTALHNDITALKFSQDAVKLKLAQEIELFNVTLGSIREGVISTDGNGAILLMNSMAEELTGWPQNSVVGEDVRLVFKIKDSRTRQTIDDPVAKIIYAGKMGRDEFFLINMQDGKERLVACSGAPMRDSTGIIIGTVIAIRDISAAKQMEDELFRARKLESVGVLAGGIAHDFNNILTGLVTNLFMAKTHVAAGSEAYELITEAEKASFRAGKLTKQLLTFAKGGTPVKEHASIRELIEDSVGFCLSGSNVDCRLEVGAEIDMVEIDRGQIDQVLNNLIINAEQAMPQGGTITIQAENILVDDEVTCNTESRLPLERGRYVKISIHDEGEGIPKENMTRIFDPYFTTKPNASGLGLTTVYSIIQKHGGLITARSNLTKGATFIFYLPSSARPAEQTRTAGSNGSMTGSGSVLVMDDEQVIRIIVEKMLKKFGYDVVCASNGSDAIEAYKNAFTKQRPFDVVIVDLTVPGGMGGCEAVRRLLEFDPAAQVVVASGYSNDPVMSDFRQYGFVDVIGKPFDIDEYLRVIQGIIERRKKAAPGA